MLVVDMDGLTTWLVDPKALVQTGPRKWLPLKRFLTLWRDAAEREARQKEKEARARPLIPPPPKKKEEAPPPPEPPPPIEAEEPPVPSEPEAPPESGFPMPEEEVPSPLATPPLSEPEQPFFASASEPLDLLNVAQEAFAPQEPIPPPVTRDEDAVILFKPVEDEAPVPAPEPPPPSSWHDRPAPPPIQTLADDPTARASGYGGLTSPLDDLPAIPLKKEPDRRNEAPAYRAPAPETKEEEEYDWDVKKPTSSDRVEEGVRRFAAALERGFIQAIKGLAELRRSSPGITPVVQTLRQWASGGIEGLKGWVARLKPRARPAPPPPAAEEPAPLADPVISPRASVEPSPSSSPPPGITAFADDPTSPRAEAGLSALESLPIIPLKPIGEPRFRALKGRLTRWVAGVTAWARRPPKASREEPVSSDSFPAPREILKAPPPLRELPTLRLAPIPIEEEEEVEEIYHGESTFFPTVWVWVKRVAVMALLVGGGVLAAQHWETWSPNASRLGQNLYSETDEYLRARELAERQRRALEEATAQLPLYDPQTIALVLLSTPGNLPDPPEVFRLAYEAEDRGLSTLTPKAAEELTGLRRQLLDTLSPAEQEVVREYESARAYRMTLPFENRGVLERFARGARTLPVEDLERLRELSGKAVASGLSRRPTQR